MKSSLTPHDSNEAPNRIYIFFLQNIISKQIFSLYFLLLKNMCLMTCKIIETLRTIISRAATHFSRIAIQNSAVR